MHTEFSTVTAAIDALREGKPVIIVDDLERENEGDIIIAAEHVSVEQMAFMIRNTSGIIFLAVSNDIADQLDLPPMVEKNTSRFGTPFTVSIEAAHDIETGVSAADRVKTIKAAISITAKPEDLVRPGHIFPLRAQDGGVLVRAGHTEASVDVVRLAGLRAGAVGAELMHDDGTMMRTDALKKFSKTHDIPIIAIADLIAYRRKNETLVRKEVSTTLETEYGEWTISVFEDAFHQKEHIALTMGNIMPMHPTLVRVHSECFTGDVFHSLHCDCGEQLDEAMKLIRQQGSGAIVYLRQEGRGIGLIEKIRAYELQRNGMDTVDANAALGYKDDLREYGIGAQILKEIGVGKMRLMTNNPKKIVGLNGHGLEIVEQVPLTIVPKSDKQKKYLQTKKEKMKHIFPFL